jgi:hypothetical protein
MDAQQLSKRRAPFANSRETLKMRSTNDDVPWPARQNSDNRAGKCRSRPTQLSKCLKTDRAEPDRTGEQPAKGDKNDRQ